MATAAVESTLRSIPLVASLDIAVSGYRVGQVSLTLPYTQANMGTGGVLAHPVLFAVGELAAVTVLGSHPALARLQRLQKGSHIEYLSAATREVTAHAAIAVDQVQAVLDAVARKGRARLEVAVQLLDSSGRDVAEVVSVFTLLA
jgi:acyl-coenzyme A thioesterase PaaI-like protein